jgi:hypothetical protein
MYMNHMSDVIVMVVVRMCCDAVIESIAENCHEKCNHCRVLVSYSMVFGVNDRQCCHMMLAVS